MKDIIKSLTQTLSSVTQFDVPNTLQLKRLSPLLADNCADLPLSDTIIAYNSIVGLADWLKKQSDRSMLTVNGRSVQALRQEQALSEITNYCEQLAATINKEIFGSNTRRMTILNDGSDKARIRYRIKQQWKLDSIKELKCLCTTGIPPKIQTQKVFSRKTFAKSLTKTFRLLPILGRNKTIIKNDARQQRTFQNLQSQHQLLPEQQSQPKVQLMANPEKIGLAKTRSITLSQYLQSKGKIQHQSQIAGSKQAKFKTQLKFTNLIHDKIKLQPSQRGAQKPAIEQVRQQSSSSFASSKSEEKWQTKKVQTPPSYPKPLPTYARLQFQEFDAQPVFSQKSIGFSGGSVVFDYSAGEERRREQARKAAFSQRRLG